ncbi:TPA: hypothetical protein DEP96_03835 [Candidatus Uhrbacteria bacterium]|nr:hypothetical protein [Candidatus Uhrbacteria bacterium]
MNDFHTVPIRVSDNLPRTFSPSVFAGAPLVAHAPAGHDDTIGEESESVKHLIAPVYQPHERHGDNDEGPKSKPAVIKPHAAEKHEDKHGGVTFKTGAGLVVEGARGVRRAVAKMVHHGRATYAGLSHHDQKEFVDIVAKHARALPTGSKIGFTTRRKIKEAIRAGYVKSEFTRSDVSKLNKLTEELK